jgi:hypothetical protein
MQHACINVFLFYGIHVFLMEKFNLSYVCVEYLFPWDNDRSPFP